jgi:hypothetical protein
MRHVISILFGALFTLVACWSTGKLLLSRFKLDVFAEELQILRFATGSALFSLLVLTLTAMHLARTEVFLGVAFVIILLSFRIKEEERLRLPDFSHGWKFLFYVVLVGFGTFYFVNALAPEASPDGSSYHLGFVAKYFRLHSLGRITTSMYASLSEGLEMLFLSAFSVGRHSSAALVEFGYFLGIPMVMLAYAQRFGFPKAGITAALIIFCSPVFGISGTSAYNDAAAVFILLCLFYSLQIWDATRQPGMLVVAGILAGFCYGIKYTLFLATPYCVCFVAWKLYRAKRPIIQPIIVVCGCATLLIAPWWIKNWVTVGNPLSPFGNQVFSNAYITPRFEHAYVKGQSAGVPAKDRFIATTIRGGAPGGFLGPLFLLAPLGLLALRCKQGRQVVLASFLFLIPAVANVQTRFLMLSAPFVALSLSLAVMNARGALIAFAFAAPLLAIPSVADSYCDSWAWRLNGFPFQDAIRAISERDSLSKRLPGFQDVELINSKVSPHGLVFATSVPPEAYLNPHDMVGYESALGETLNDILMVALDPDFQPTWIQTFRFPEKACRRIRIVETGAGTEDDYWKIGELKLYRAGAEVPRTKDWRLNASSNPWEANYMLDDNPVTRWRSGTKLIPDMQVELDLGKLEKIDTVQLACSHDEYAIRLRLETQDASGHWSQWESAPEIGNRPAPGNLRRLAIEQFKLHGITHILLNKGDYVAADFQQNQEAWGISLAGQAGDDWLYEIK